MNQLLKNVSELYNNLIPEKVSGMTVLILFEKIKQKQIPRYFSYRDVEEAIRQATANELGPQPHTERILKSLLHYFIERPPRQRAKYMLTDYASKFVKLIESKLDNPYKRFPLRETFDQYAQFNANDIRGINDFESWYERGFNDITKQTIIDHLEALKDEVNASVKELHLILKEDFEEAEKIANRFAVVFKDIGEKTSEIKDALRLANVLGQEIQTVVDSFSEELDACKHPENEAEQQTFDALAKDYRQAIKIKGYVSDFFLQVDERLAQLTEKILFASEQLKSLQNNFRNHSRFRVHLKKLLTFTLKEATFSKDGPKLPNKFPRKVIPLEVFKFIHVPYYDSFAAQRNEVIPPQINEEHAQREKATVHGELIRQENTAKWVRKYKHIINHEKKLNFTDHFYKILAEEGDIEIALKVGFELFQFANNHPNYKIYIQKELPSEQPYNNIQTWKMYILQRA